MSQKFHYSFEVCKCHKVNLGEIIFALKEQNAMTLKDIAFHTNAGTSCRCCINKLSDRGEVKMELYLEQILSKFNKK